MVSLVAESRLVTQLAASPNYGERSSGQAPSLLILHYTGMASAEIAYRWLLDPASQVSCHYLVQETGEVVQMVSEARRAWHAGRSIWQGVSDINSASIGIEIVNPGHEFGYRDFPAAQMEAVALLSADIVRRWDMKRDAVLAHSDIAPLRKEDPGERFDWRRLADAGAGLWVEPVSIGGGGFLTRGEEGRPVEALQAMLALFGYGIAVTGRFDELTEAVVRAFQRHYRQALVDGVADASTIETLRALLAEKARGPGAPAS